MFQTDKPLEDMDIIELEAVRKVWKEQAEYLIAPLLPAFLIGWSCSLRTEGKHTFYDIDIGAMQISIYHGKRHYDPVVGDYLSFLNIQVKSGLRPVANLTFDFYGVNLEEGKWQDAPHLFARPDVLDWTGEIRRLVGEWQYHLTQSQATTAEQQRQRLLALLKEGKYT